MRLVLPITLGAAIHHGDAGTAAAVLRAGKPAVICPFFGDQPFWGRRIAALCAGPPPLPLRALSEERLAEAIVATDDPSMRRRAAELGKAIRLEDGVAAAVVFIKETVAKRSPHLVRSEGPRR